MRIEALKHLATSAAALAPETTIVVFGSASAFATYPELGLECELYKQTKDADLIFEPWEQSLGQALNNAVGKTSSFYDHFGYYADIISPAAFDNFPPGFRDRLVPLEGCPRVFALDPHDMAVAKLFAGRPKDIRLLSFLFATDRLDEAKVRKMLWDTPMEEKWIVKTHAVLDQVLAEAAMQRVA
ncbi:MAG: DUF6036 family nucleotidyltransferase [Verrucomicrobia bacterium]|nr:DUF6036 family nucleotidyltransferase [Verrucomicrobiota bacterium]